MSLGNNIQFLRKNLGLTQEAFSEKMGVSRQTISKWESDLCYPEMDKLVLMCDLFGCDLDTLVRGDTEKTFAVDDCGYDKHMNKFAKSITSGVVIVLMGLISMFLLYGFGVAEDIATISLLAFVAVAVAIFIISGIQHDDFQKANPIIQPFYSKEEISKFKSKYPIYIVSGVTLIMLAVIFLLGANAVFGEHMLNENETLDSFIMVGFFVFITIAVGLFVYSGIQNDKYNLDNYNKITDNDKSSKEKIKSAISGCIMLTATCIFLVTGLIFNSWHINWVVFPIGGILCGIASIIVDTVNSSKKDN